MTSSSSTHNNVTNTKNYEYDGLDNITREYTGTYSQEYTYDNNSNVTAYSFKEGNTVKNSISYSYNNMNRITSETINGSLISYGYNANGKLTSKSINGVWSSSYTYNNAGQLTGLTDLSAGTYSCTYRPDGFRESETKPDGSIVYYSYDGYGRLSMEEAYDLNEDYIYDRRYYYNSRGNRTREYKDYDQYHYSYNNANNKLTSYYDDNELVNFSYDDNGNLTSKVIYDYDTLNETGSITYEYDNFNRLISYTEGNNTTTYSYYADNLRASKTDSSNNTTSFIWNGQNLAYEGTGTDAKYYSYDITGIAAVKTGGEQKIYAKNPHNDIIGQINLSGVLSGAKDFNSFGELVSCTSVSGFGYAGEYHDAESGYIYLRNRYYDPDIGRFITEDPAKDGTNWYVYCGNNPVMFYDPWGLSYEDVINALGIIYNAKNAMYHTTPGTQKYNNSYEHIIEQKNVIRSSEIYMEDWSGLKKVLEPIVNGNNNSLTTIKSTKEQVEYAKAERDKIEKRDNAIFTAVLVGGITIAVKAASTLLSPGGGLIYPGNDPSKSPGKGWEWRGNGTPEDGGGNWYNPSTGETLHPDVHHEDPIGPHWDYRASRDSPWYRWFPDGHMELK